MSNIQFLLNPGIVTGQVGNNQTEEKKDAGPIQAPGSNKDKFDSQNNSGPAIKASIVDSYKTLLVAISRNDEDAINQAEEKIYNLKSAYKNLTGERFTLPTEEVKFFEKVLSRVTERTVDVQNKLLSALSFNDREASEDLFKQLSIFRSMNVELKKMLGKPNVEKIDYPKDVLDERTKMIESLKEKILDLEKQIIKAPRPKIGSDEFRQHFENLKKLTTMKAILGILQDFADQGEEKKKPIPSEVMA